MYGLACNDDDDEDDVYTDERREFVAASCNKKTCDVRCCSLARKGQEVHSTSFPHK